MQLCVQQHHIECSHRTHYTYNIHTYIAFEQDENGWFSNVFWIWGNELSKRKDSVVIYVLIVFYMRYVNIDFISVTLSIVKSTRLSSFTFVTLFNGLMNTSFRRMKTGNQQQNRTMNKRKNPQSAWTLNTNRRRDNELLVKRWGKVTSFH